MAQYNVVQACGCTTTLVLFGKESGRDYAKARAAEQKCPACAAAAAAEASEAAGLPALAGSDKQVAWAQKIRAQFLAKVDGMAPAPAALADQAQAVIAQLRARGDAKFWIDNRDKAAIDLLRMIANGG
jgi:hypothetical protein